MTNYKSQRVKINDANALEVGHALAYLAGFPQTKNPVKLKGYDFLVVHVQGVPEEERAEQGNEYFIKFNRRVAPSSLCALKEKFAEISSSKNKVTGIWHPIPRPSARV